MTVDPLTLLAIVIMGAITYWTRVAGFWLVRRIPLRGRLAHALDAVPGAVLVALIAPAVFTTGLAESAAAAAALLVALVRGPMILALAAAMLAAVAIRSLL